MPLVIATGAPQGMPADLAAIAEEQDALIGEEMADLVPRPDRPYSAKVYSALTDAIAKAAKVMGLDLTPERYTEDVAQMDGDGARFLPKMTAAASTYGTAIPVSPTTPRGRPAHCPHAPHTQRASDKAFAEFLDAPAEPEEVIEEETVMPDGEVDEEEVEEVDFSKRMRRR